MRDTDDQLLHRAQVRYMHADVDLKDTTLSCDCAPTMPRSAHELASETYGSISDGTRVGGVVPTGEATLI